MTYDEKIQWLRRYQESLRKERELAREVEQLHSEACRMSPLLSGMPGAGSDGQGLPRAVESILAAKQELQAQIHRCGAVRREILAAVEQIQNPRDHEILRRKYILGQRWEQIAVDMGYELRWLYRLHHRALDAVAEISH